MTNFRSEQSKWRLFVMISLLAHYNIKSRCRTEVLRLDTALRTFYYEHQNDQGVVLQTAKSRISNSEIVETVKFEIMS